MICFHHIGSYFCDACPYMILFSILWLRFRGPIDFHQLVVMMSGGGPAIPRLAALRP